MVHVKEQGAAPLPEPLEPDRLLHAVA
jgi:hypothetical protein